jgi:anti-sigma regulatory factor (Ser/Thr protein kinase)
VPLNHQTLTLGADPRAVQEARRWVASVCHELDRDDLLECAELGVSELVTNALLHADAPITVRVRGTTLHPRIEVGDGSPHPPQLIDEPPELDDLISTFGRGMSIVARCSVAWGATVEHDGKVVWFEPAEVPHQDRYPDGAIFNAEEPPVHHGDPARHLVPIVVRAVPVSTMHGLHLHYNELRREVRLLSLAHEETYPLARDLTDIFGRFDRAYPREASEQVDQAHAAGLDRVDLDVKVDPAHRETFEQMLSLLDLADEFCRAQRLLAIARTPEQVEFQRWFFGEFVRQAAGGAPEKPSSEALHGAAPPRARRSAKIVS